MAKVDITHMPYRGAAPALADLMAGRVDMMFAVMGSGLPLVQSGQLRALAVTTDKRMASAPDVPTIAETGVPGYDSLVVVRVLPAGQDAARDRQEGLARTR